MAWHCVAKIKNDLNEFTFANFPLEQYNGYVSGGATSIGWTSYREQNAQGGTPDFMRASAIADDLATQADIPRLEVGSSYVKMVFGTIGGSAVDLRYVQRSHSGTQYGLDIEPYVYRSMQGTRMYVGSYSYDTSKDTNLTWTWGLAINEETEEIYLMSIRAWIRWYYGIGVYAYYDRATASAVIFDNNSQYNLWDIFKDSIAGGGGGNPYEGGGYSEPTEETGDFDETSDIIEEPTLPASLAVSSGFLTVYNPTYTQVVDLGNYVWNSLPLDTFKKMFANPMDVIIGLSIFPFLIDDDSRNWEIMIGNINSHVTARKARNQFQVVDCGKLYIKPYSKSYLDYSPYTKIELALPYIGTKQLDTDIIMGKWIWVKYRVDLISGGCMAILSFSDTENGEYSVIAEYTGKCNIEIPISGSDFRELGRGILQAVAGTGAILLSNGAVGGDWVGSGLANMVTGMKPNIERSGGLTSCIGLLGVQKPRIIKTIPRQCVPENQAQLQGYPVLIKDNFANLEGFTSFEEVNIKGARMTEREKQRAKELLESGVIK